jgi:WD40 repeat protein/serine/threonine protein kinase
MPRSTGSWQDRFETGPAKGRKPEPDLHESQNWPRLSNYEVLAPVGRGGMGIVYRARQISLNREVALKRLRSDSERDLARSRREAHTLAQFKHPHIVQIYEFIQHEGQAYLALEFVDGGSLETCLQGKPQVPQSAAQLIETLARAVDHAHQHGVIHRDLKPANILLVGGGLGSREGYPTVGHPSTLTDYQPKITDFGIAKRLAVSSSETHEGDVIGTPNYMAPEQAAGNIDAIGPATDIYGLGVILYEMLTGRVPIQGPTTLDTLVRVRTEEPLAPRRLQPQIPRDLETICLKCLEKEAPRRYSSTLDLADDLRRFLDGKPILARPTPHWERSWKWTRRHPLIACLSAIVLLVTVLSFALLAAMWRAEAEASRAALNKENQEREARQQAESFAAGTGLSQGTALWETGEIGRALLWMAHSLGLAERAGDANLALVARFNLVTWPSFFVRQRAQFDHAGWVWSSVFSPDERTVATVSNDKTARLWDITTDQPRGNPMRHSRPVWAAAFSPDGKTLLTGSGDDDAHAGEARRWDVATGRPLGGPVPHHGEVTEVAFSPDGRTFLTACPEEARLWSAEDDRPVGLPMPQPRVARANPRAYPKLSALFSPDGKYIATGGEDGTARLWDAATAQPKCEPLRTTGAVLALAFSPNSRILATGSFDGAAQLWDVSTGRPQGHLLTNRGRVKTITFSPDGALLATGCAIEETNRETGGRSVVGGEVRLWRTDSGAMVGPALSHPGPVWSLSFSPRGHTLLTGCEDCNARLFLVATGTPIGKPLWHGGSVRTVTYNRAGSLALTSSAGSAGRLWQMPSEELLPGYLLQTGNILCMDFSPDGTTLLTGAADGTVRLWDVVNSRPIITPLSEADRLVSCVAFSPDGSSYLTCSEDDRKRSTVRLWDRATHRVRFQFTLAPEVHCAVFAPDGESFLVAWGSEGNVQLWSTKAGRRLAEARIGGNPLRFLSFSPDGRELLTSNGSNAFVCAPATLGLLREWPLRPGLGGGAFYPEGGKALLIADGFAQDWEPASGKIIGPPRFQVEGGIQIFAFGPAGRRVVVGARDRPARLWDVATGMLLGLPAGGIGTRSVAYSPNGKFLAAGSQDGTITISRIPEPATEPCHRLRNRIGALTGMALDPQGAVRDLEQKTDLSGQLGR